MFYNGAAILDISDNGGEYDIKCDLPDMEIPEIKIGSVTEDGDTLNAIASTDMLKGKDIPCAVTFDGDSAEGFLKVPFLGKLKLQDGEKIG